MIGYTIEKYHEMLREKKISVDDIIKELLNEAKLNNDILNGFTMINNDLKVDELNFNNILAGIPYVAKDNFSTKGIKTTASSKILENYVPFFDATVIEKLNKQQSIMIGKSSMDELGMGGTNLSALTGPVANPWDTTRISGGSSGGSAAIVGSGLVPYALGTDTGDSIRKPAAYCGIVGMKPTWGLISRYGVVPYASSLDHVGAFTRTVADMAIVIGSIAGRDDKDMTSSANEVCDYYKNLSADIKGKKIAVLKNIYDVINKEEIKTNFDEIVTKVKEVGATVDFIDFDSKLLAALLPAYMVIANSEATSNHANFDGVKFGLRVEADNLADMMKKSRTEGFSVDIRSRYIIGSYALSKENQAKIFIKAKQIRRLVVDKFMNILKEYDAVLLPAAGDVAPKIDGSNVDYLSESYLYAENHLALANFSGTPSITIPSGFVDDMPIGVNITGRLFDEQTVFNIALAIENLTGLKNQYAGGKQNG